MKAIVPLLFFVLLGCADKTGFVIGGKYTDEKGRVYEIRGEYWIIKDGEGRKATEKELEQIKKDASKNKIEIKIETCNKHKNCLIISGKHYQKNKKGVLQLIKDQKKKDKDG